MKLSNKSIFCRILLLCLIVSTASPADAGNPVSKKRIAVLDIKAFNSPSAAARLIEGGLEYNLFKTGYYDVLERSRIDLILKEKSMMVGECSDEKCASGIGKTVSADYIVMGNINKLITYTITVKVVKVDENKIVLSLKEMAGSLDDLMNITNDISARVHRGLLDIDENIRIPVAKTSYFSIGMNYLAPLGYLGNDLSTGIGASLEGGVTNFLINNDRLGVSLHVLYFDGKADIVHHSLLLPILFDAAYIIKIWRFDINPVIGLGVGYNSNYQYRFVSGSELKVTRAVQGMSRLGLDTGFFISDNLSINIKTYWWQVYDPARTGTFYSLSGGIGLQF